jgi:acyl dehydratase
MLMPPSLVKNPESLKEWVGKDIGLSEWFQVTQERIAQFAEATEDRQWIHIDPERASKGSPYGSTIAHGFLTLSLISHLTKAVIQFENGPRLVLNYGLNRVRFPAAVRADSRIRARVALLVLKDLPGALEATYSITIESDQSDKPTCIAEWIVRYYR